MLLGSFRSFLLVLTVRESRELPAILLPGIFAHVDSYGGMPTHVISSLLTQRKPPVGRVLSRVGEAHERSELALDGFRETPANGPDGGVRRVPESRMWRPPYRPRCHVAVRLGGRCYRWPNHGRHASYP